MLSALLANVDHRSPLQWRLDMLRNVSVLAVALVLTPLLAWAQNSGKLSGTVIDRTTNEPLPGATVVVEGTQLGTATNGAGEYFIIGVPVGTYTIRASFVGFESLVYEDVEVNAGYTRELNFALGEDVATLGALVVEYERPLIQKDAIGVPKVVTGEEIENLAVRGVNSVAAIQGGVVANEGSNALNVRGGREEEVVYFVDGVKVIGATAVAQQAIQEQEMIIGSLPAKYGDAMSGVISISTKTGGSDFFGSLEGITSEVLDDYGYNLASASLGGPLLGGLSFFVAGEYQNLEDSDPRAVGATVLDESRINALKENPEVLRFLDENGVEQYLPIPGDLPEGVHLNEVLAEIGAPEGWTLDSPLPINGSEVEPIGNFSEQPNIPNRKSEVARLNGNITFQPSSAISMRVTGRWEDWNRNLTTGNTLEDTERLTFGFDRFRTDQQKTLGFGGSWTHRLSNSTFYQLQADWSRYERYIHDPLFSNDVRNNLFIGDIDHSNNIVASRYRIFNAEDSTYIRRYSDGQMPSPEGVYSVLAAPGTASLDYQHNLNQQFRIGANATTQIGLHQIEFGGEFEQRTQRLYVAFAGLGGVDGAARFFNDGDVEAGEGQGVDSWDELPYNAIKNTIDYYGFNYLGTIQTDQEDVDRFVEGATSVCNTDPGSSLCDSAPYEPVYYAGYVQDKIEYKDLVLNVGLRVDVFDGNSLILKDRHALLPIVRADAIGDRPNNVDTDFAVYFDANGEVVGYRDLDGRFFDENGQGALGADITRLGAPSIPEGAPSRLSSDVFEDYEPDVNWMPRVGVSFPVTDQALFFAHYDVTAQRPFESVHDGLEEYFLASEGNQRVNNNGLKPTRTTEYELGFRQRIGARSAFTISGYYKKIDNLIQLETIAYGYPNGYSFYGNNDFGTVKGVQFEFDLRRTNNVAINANYTLQFANGTGSDSQTATQIAWRGPADGSGFPNTLSPLDFDRRHSINVNLDYRLGKGEGPRVGNATIFENFGLNLVTSLRSGQPFTLLQGASPIYNSFILPPAGSLNGDNLPWSSLTNLRIDRRFDLSTSFSMTAFLWIQNLFNSDNVIGVFRATGLADEDGFRSTGEGRDFVNNQEIPANAGYLYGVRVHDPTNYGIPRQVRLGLRVNF
jgi:outer membrane receptor protein involved in Fe transport